MEDSLSKIIRHLPEGEKDISDLRENICSPEFQSALESLDSLVWSDELKNLCISFGIFDQKIYEEAKDPIEAFVWMI